MHSVLMISATIKLSGEWDGKPDRLSQDERTLVMVEYQGAKVFTATKAKEREVLGGRITQWLEENPDIKIKDTKVLQSSDNEFHCLSIIIFYDYK
jgi:hypothetical protein